MAIIRQDYGSIGGQENNKYQTLTQGNGALYILIGQGNTLRKIPSMSSSDKTYEDDFVSWTITNYNSGLWTITNKKPCTLTINSGTPTQLAANTTTNCVYTGGLYELDFN